MSVAIVGVPGAEISRESLDNLVTQKIVSFYEVNGQQAVFYWRGLPARYLEHPVTSN